ncbi:MAG: NADH-quinone oxidoreductase subunit NuoG [Armatimonadota bacterium]|nr:NADH-quinone oxidoreductase subunit NuoG [Armatimonadota bacterium]MDR5702467.1 NADH-quinone oxidoreductase subunit NuoG [Armatimonadota bacterium]MDR7433566.1 NADH-quinone oxidoreductase subunit NuoG [Armatimonadota bacterium]
MTEVTLTIDGKIVTVPKGTTVYLAARKAGIEIPIFCYHDRMPPLGACRMCLVQVEKMPRLQTACTLEAQEGMVVHTETPEVRQAREGILEFLLINHPLDCPICDKGGECPLQDFTFRYGPGRSRFVEQKRDFPKPIPLSPVLMLDRERCILCWRCVRFCEIISGDDALEGFDRGFLSQIQSVPEKVRTSKFIGNTIMICPVGALTSRTYRFRARPWDNRTVPSVCMHCGLGCSIELDVRSNEVVRVRPRENPDLNDIWLCDLGWFGYEFVNHPDRLTAPLIRKDSTFVEASWEEALDLIAERLREVRDPRKVGVLGSSQLTSEEGYLLQKFFRKVVGTNNIDYRLDATPWGASLRVPWGMEVAVREVEEADAILLVGSDITEEYPILWLRMKKAVDRGASLILLGPKEPEVARFAHVRLLTRMGQEGSVLTAIVGLCRAHQGSSGAGERTTSIEEVARLSGVDPDAIITAARILSGAKRPLLFIGRMTLDGPGGLVAMHALEQLRSSLEVPLNILRGRGNARGAAIAGLLPDHLPGPSPLQAREARETVERLWGGKIPPSRGYTALEMLEACRRGEVEVLYVACADPATEVFSRRMWEEARAGVQFLVVTSLFLTETASQADVVLPALSFAEKEGTVVNLEGLVQHISPARRGPGTARSEGEILVELALRLGQVLEYGSWKEVCAEMQELIPGFSVGSRISVSSQPLHLSAPTEEEGDQPEVSGTLAPAIVEKIGRVEGDRLLLVTGDVLFDHTDVTRRCTGIATLAGTATLSLNPIDAGRLGIGDGDLVAVSGEGRELLAVARVSGVVPPGHAFLPLGFGEAPVNLLVMPDRPYTAVRVTALERV